MYCGKKKAVAKTELFCEDCGTTIEEGDKYIAALYDYALDASDGYGVFDEVPLCQHCGREEPHHFVLYDGRAIPPGTKDDAAALDTALDEADARKQAESWEYVDAIWYQGDTPRWDLPPLSDNLERETQL